METISSLIAYKNRKQRIWFDTHIFEDLQPMPSDQAKQLIEGWEQVEWSLAKETPPQTFAQLVASHLIRTAYSSANAHHQTEYIRNALSFIAGYFRCRHSVIRVYGNAFHQNGVFRKASFQYVLEWQDAIVNHRWQNGDDQDLLEALNQLLHI